MKPARICIAFAVVLAAYSLPGPASSQPKPPENDAATQLFKAGKFAEADKLYSRLAADDPQDYEAILQLARIALLSNQLDDAQRWLDKAISLRLGDADAKVMLAEVFYRRDDFQKAAAVLKGVDVRATS